MMVSPTSSLREVQRKVHTRRTGQTVPKLNRLMPASIAVCCLVECQNELITLVTCLKASGLNFRLLLPGLGLVLKLCLEAVDSRSVGDDAPRP